MNKLAQIIIMMIPAFCWSQSTDRHATETTIVSNWDRLNIDFEVKDIPHPDENQVVQINLDQYESLRQENNDVEVHDTHSGYVLILYSTTKTFNKKKQRDSHATHESPHQH